MTINKLDISGQPPKAYDGPTLEDFMTDKQLAQRGLSGDKKAKPVTDIPGVLKTRVRHTKVKRLQKELEQEPLKSALKEHLPKK